jgi:hypothetical protein
MSDTRKLSTMDPGTRILELGMTLAQAREQIAALPPEVSAALDSWMAAQRAADEAQRTADKAMAALRRAARRAGTDGIDIQSLARIARRDQPDA